jgi:hypothetical protein
LNGSKHHLHTNADPGGSIPVKDGKLVLASLKIAPGAPNNP